MRDVLIAAAAVLVGLAASASFSQTLGPLSNRVGVGRVSGSGVPAVVATPGGGCTFPATFPCEL